jgi:hypothetical protein
LLKDRKASLSARREGIVVSQLKTVLNEKFRAYCWVGLFAKCLPNFSEFFCKFCVFSLKFSGKKILSWNFDLSESLLTKGMGQNNIFIQKKSKSIMRFEPWPSSLSSQRYNQNSIFRILIRSIIKVNKIIFVLAAPHIFCVIFKTKKSEICCESVTAKRLKRLKKTGAVF